MKFSVGILGGPFDNLYHFVLFKNNESVLLLNETMAKVFEVSERELIDRIVSKVVSNEKIKVTENILYFKKELTNDEYIEKFKNEFIEELTTLNLK